VGIDTTFICFLIDEEVNQTPEKMRAHPKLINLFAKHGAKSMEIGAKKSDRHMNEQQRERRKTFIAEKDAFQQRVSIHANAHRAEGGGTNNMNGLLAE